MKALKLILVAACFFLAVTIHAQGIITAATAGDFAKVKELIENNPQLVNVKDAGGRTPLHWAARGVHFEVLKYLVEKGAGLNIKDNNNITALASTVSRNHVEAVRYLLNKGAMINVADNRNETPLHYAASQGYKELVEILVKNNAKLELKNTYGRTPLLLAARECGIIDIVKILVENGADINVKDNSLDTPLSLAAWRGFEKIVNYLIDNNAEIAISGAKGKALFAYSLNKRLWNLYRTIMAKGVRIDDLNDNKNNALHWAAKGGSELIVKDLIDRKQQVNVKDMFGFVPLHYAAKYGRLSVVKVLVENGADLNVKTRLNESPLNLAQKAGFKEVSDYLSSKGADHKPIEYTKLQGKYFGQKEPGNKPEIFAPGIVTNILNGHSNVVFSPDGEEAFWTEWNEMETGYSDGCRLLYTKIENGFWKVPWVILKKGDTPIYSIDGTRVYFMASVQQPTGRPLGEIQYFEINNGVLSAPKSSQFKLEGTGLYWQFCFDKNENIYFSGSNGLQRALFKDGNYLAPETLSELFNSEYKGTSPYISPAGDYIIFSSSGSFGGLDLFIGYKKKDGTWTNPINLGSDINTSVNEHLPIVSIDGKYLFFVSNRGEGDFLRFWVSAKIIEDLRPQD